MINVINGPSWPKEMCFCFKLGGIFASVSNLPNDELLKSFSRHSKGDSHTSGRPSPTTITWAGRGLFLTHFFSLCQWQTETPLSTSSVSCSLSLGAQFSTETFQRPCTGGVCTKPELSEGSSRSASWNKTQGPREVSDWGHHWEAVEVRGEYEEGMGAHFVVLWMRKQH